MRLKTYLHQTRPPFPRGHSSYVYDYEYLLSRWMTRRGALRNDHASIRRNLSQRGHRALIDGRALHLRGNLSPDAAEVPSNASQRARQQTARRRVVSILQQLQVCDQKTPIRESSANFLKAAAAAKINAQIQARKGVQHVDVPPIQSSLTSPAPPSASTSKRWRCEQ